uniref:Uncharacterized protein n=1 Tax=Arundo donax TaxID=35708 RepID=A0A0A9FCX4_ARUDO
MTGRFDAVGCKLASRCCSSMNTCACCDRCCVPRFFPIGVFKNVG